MFRQHRRLLKAALLAALCMGWIGPTSDAIARPGAKRATSPKPAKAKVRNAIKAYRGLYVAPGKYDPQKFASRWAFRNGKTQKVSWDQIHVHKRLNGAVGYATSESLTKTLAASGKGRLKETVVIEFGLPNRLLKWDSPGAERAHFKRNKIPDDRAYIEKIGVVRQRKPTAKQMETGRFERVTRGGSKRFVEWMTPDTFFARYQDSK